MRILIAGAAGQVGRALVAESTRRGHVALGGYVSRVPRLPPEQVARLDKLDPSSIQAAIRQLEPDAIVDAGALHNVDYCESHPDEAGAINRDGTERLARAAAERGSRFVFLSTDYVFDGSGNPPYRESDLAHPLSVYGRSKLEGETAARRTLPSAIIVRTSVIYSWIPPVERSVSVSQKSVNFGSWVIDQLSAGKPMDIVSDQIASPTPADALAAGIVELLERPKIVGTFHIAGATPVDRYEFTRRLAIRLGFPTEQVRPITTAALRQTAPRPSNSSLDSTHLAAETGYRMPDLSTALESLRMAYVAT